MTSTHRGAPTDPAPHVVRLWLTCLTILGAALRFHRLDAQSLWIDEIMTLKTAGVGSPLSLQVTLQNNQGPLHGLVIYLVSLFSTSEFALRSVSALAGVAAIPAVYLLGKELSSRRAGLIAAALTSLSPFAVWYSQEVRNYSFLILFSAAATLAVWKVLVRREEWWQRYAVSIVLALYCNMSAAFVVVAHNVFCPVRLLRERPLLVRWVATYAVVALLFAPAAYGIVHWARVDAVGERVTLVPIAAEEELLRGETTFTPMGVPYSVFAMMYGYSLGPSLRELHVRPPLDAFMSQLWLVGPAGLVAAAALVLGLRSLLKQGTSGRFAAAALGVPFVLAAVLAILNIKVWNARYLSVTFPVLMVTAAAGVDSLGRKRGAWLLALVVLFCGVSMGAYYGLPKHWREDVRAAASYVEAREKPGDVVFAPVVKLVFDHYYDGALDDYGLHLSRTGSAAEMREAVESGLVGHERVWFVRSRLWAVDPGGVVQEYLDSRGTRLSEEGFPGVEVILYALDGSSE